MFVLQRPEFQPGGGEAVLCLIVIVVGHGFDSS